MGPHLVWAFVVLCGFALVAWMWRRFTDAVDLRDDVLALRGKAVALVTANLKLEERIAALEADIKPIKTKFSAGEFGKLGGGR